MFDVSFCNSSEWMRELFISLLPALLSLSKAIFVLRISHLLFFFLFDEFFVMLHNRLLSLDISIRHTHFIVWNGKKVKRAKKKINNNNVNMCLRPNRMNDFFLIISFKLKLIKWQLMAWLSNEKNQYIGWSTAITVES